MPHTNKNITFPNFSCDESELVLNKFNFSFILNDASSLQSSLSQHLNVPVNEFSVPGPSVHLSMQPLA